MRPPRFTAAFLALVVMCLFSAPTSSQERMDLSDAIRIGYVTIGISNLGGSSGDVVVVTVTRTKAAGSRSLSLSVRPGTMLRSLTGGVQSMTVAAVKGKLIDASRKYLASRRIEVSREAMVRYLIEAYCTEFEKENPSATTEFTLDPPDAAIACVLERAAKGKLSISATQAAVWIVTDRLNFNVMQKRFIVSASEWSQAEAVVRGCSGG